jgi:hypothetical protein
MSRGQSPSGEDPGGRGREMSEQKSESAMISVLLQEHRVAQTALFTYDIVGRLASAALVVYFGSIASLSVPQLLSGVLAATMTAIFWQWGRRRALRTARGVEEALGRTTDGFAERIYIESRFISESGWQPIERYLWSEPYLWLCASIAVLALNAVLGGLSA